MIKRKIFIIITKNAAKMPSYKKKALWRTFIISCLGYELWNTKRTLQSSSQTATVYHKQWKLYIVPWNCWTSSREAVNTYFVVFGLTQPGIKSLPFQWQMFHSLNYWSVLSFVYQTIAASNVMVHFINIHFKQFVRKKTAKSFTSTSKISDNCSAFVFANEFPAFVTKTVGTRNFPCLSVNLANAFLAAQIGFLPLTRTPSMSKSKPNLGS